jgi:NTE family protein
MADPTVRPPTAPTARTISSPTTPKADAAEQPKPSAPAAAATATPSIAPAQDAFKEARVQRSPLLSQPSGAGILGGIFGKNDREKLIDSTRDLRDTAAQGRSIQAQLDRTPPSDPNHARLKQQLAAVDQKLQQKYGYTTATAPKPGTLFLDPQFNGGQLPNGQVLAKSFPTGKPVTAPPSAIDALFQRGGPVQTRGADGKLVTLRTPDEYKAFVAQQRKANGMARTDGEPIAAQFVFEGGGGKGKRYGPMMMEMVNNGVVPVSASGSSAGAIAAAFVAAGADPETVQKLTTDPKLSKLFDVDLGSIEGGLMDGEALYNHIDQQLREITGIKDRPVTFADLKMPLQILATRMSDTASGGDPMTTVDSRRFVFSQETTPNTPVALAVRASAAIPGAFDPVQMVDPMTGREVMLTDGGVIDNLPMGLAKHDLPVVGVTLQDQNQNHPKDSGNNATAKPLPKGNINVGNLILNGWYGKKMHDAAAPWGDDFRDRAHPKPGQFMLGLPTWDLNDPSRGNGTLKFGYDPKVDPVLDQQGRQVTRDFLRQYLGDMGQPGKSGTNAITQLPPNLSFSRDVQVNGRTYTATYSGGDTVRLQEKGGRDSFNLNLGKQKIESMWLDDKAYGDLPAKLQHEAKKQKLMELIAFSRAAA